MAAFRLIPRKKSSLLTSSPSPTTSSPGRRCSRRCWRPSPPAWEMAIESTRSRRPRLAHPRNHPAPEPHLRRRRPRGHPRARHLARRRDGCHRRGGGRGPAPTASPRCPTVPVSWRRSSGAGPCQSALAIEALEKKSGVLTGGGEINRLRDAAGGRARRGLAAPLRAREGRNRNHEVQGDARPARSWRPMPARTWPTCSRASSEALAGHGAFARHRRRRWRWSSTTSTASTTPPTRFASGASPPSAQSRARR